MPERPFASPWLLSVLGACLLVTALTAGRQQVVQDSLTTMVETERAFAARALVVGWKRAFLEYFAPDAVGFENREADLAREQIQRRPDPPADLRVIWEPRFGDIAASGELGYLTGPVQHVVASQNGGRPRHSTYLSIWKRREDGVFAVIMDVGTPTPAPVPFPPGFTRALHANRFAGDFTDRTPPLSTADGILNSRLRTGQVRAYTGRLAAGARLHRPNILPLVGERRILGWLASQPPMAATDSQFAESARSSDLGYTWGTYTVAGRAGNGGFYVRLWVRERDGQWKVAVDVTQPQ